MSDDAHRDFPGRVHLIAVLRVIHVVGVVGLGAAVLNHATAAGATTGYVAALVGSGLGIALLDAFANRAYFQQVNGGVVLAKLVLLGLLGWSGLMGAPAFWLLLVLSVLSAHAPGRWRHRRVFR